MSQPSRAWDFERHESRDRIVSCGVTDAEFTAFVNSTYRVLTSGLRGPATAAAGLAQIADVGATATTGDC